MRKLLIGLGAVVAILVGVVLIGPSFIDWNSYKGQIESQAEAFTGRKLTIGGDISIQILPAPALVARDIAFANAPQSEVENMLELGSIEVRVALGPLFSGEVQVSKIVLIEPVVELEKFADGSNNWTIDTGQKAAEDASADAQADTADPSGDGSADALADITLDHFSVDRGTLVFRDHQAGTTHVVEDINATLKAASLQGPFEATGSLRTMDMPVRFEIGVDGIFQGRTVPVTGNLTAGDDAVTVTVTGNILNLLTTPKFNGTLGVEAKSIARAASLAGAAGLPPMLNRPLNLNTSVEASAEGAVLDGFKMSLGETSVDGRVDVALGDVPQIGVAFTVPHLNADDWLADAGGSTSTAATSATSSGDASASGTNTQPDATAPAFAIPDTIDANLDLAIESIVYRGEKAGPVHLSAGLAGGEVTVSQMTAQLPGAADISLFGFLTAADGEPSLNGEAKINIGDTRGLARWLGVALDNVPADRLRRLDAQATIVGNAKQLQIANVKASFDSTNLSGGLTLALRDRLSFGAAVSIDTINLDPYLAGMASSPSSATAGSESGASTESAAGTAASAETNPYAALAALKDFDANVRLNAGEVVYNGLPIRKIAVDATLYGGDLTLRDVSVADAGGASLAVDGKIGGLGGIPQLDGLNVALKASDAGRLAKLANVDLPVPSKALGQISLKAAVNGNALQPSVKGTLGAAGGTVWIDGKASTLPIAPLYEGALRIAHPDTAGLLKALETGYTPSGKIGGVDLSMNTSVTAKKVSLSGIRGTLNQTAVQGDAGISLGGARPRLESALTLDQLRVDPFMPKEASQSSGSSSGGSSSGSGTASTGYAKGEAPWPKDPIDLSGLGAADARLTLNVGRLSYQKIDFDKAVVKLTLDDRLLTVEQLSGVAFGGNLDFAGAVNGRATPAANGTFAFKNASISNLLTAVIGDAAAIGALNVETAFDTSGASVADMVGALNGNGGFSMKGVDVTGSTQGSAMSGFLGLIRGFGQIGAGLGGKKLDGLADIGGQFVIKQGVASVNPLNIDSALGTGAAGGTVDLAGWNMDMAGSLDVSGNLLTAILGQKLGGVTKLPFSMKGPLDAPDVNVDTGGLQGVGIPVPGLDKLEEKLPGVGSILQGVLGGGQQQQSSGSTSSGSGTSQGTTSEPPPQPSQQQKTIEPEKLLKDLLGF